MNYKLILAIFAIVNIIFFIYALFKTNSEMKKLILMCVFFAICIGNTRVIAQNESGIFNSLSVGTSVGSSGIGIDLASPIGNYLALRAGVSFVPNITFNTSVDVDIDAAEFGSISSEMDVEGALKRASGDVLVNVYPFRSAGFFICAGAYFGGNQLIKIKGHSDELADKIAEGANAGIEIGDYSIPVDKDGNVSGGLKVSSFRPYVGIGFGRAVPKKRVGFMVDLGVQFHGTPEVYTNSGNLSALAEEADNDFTKIIDKLTVYPVLKFRICGKIF